ncbi:MAG: hypothetical protein E7214_05965 [Clostridium sp.]|nr:hypothetical protein [Clostridium sp.]
MAVYIMEDVTLKEIDTIKSHIPVIYNIGFNSIQFSFKYDFINKNTDYNEYLKKCKEILDEIKKYSWKHLLLKVAHVSNFQELESESYLNMYKVFLEKLIIDLQDYDFTIISISNEAGELTSSKYTDFWVDVIQNVRKVYSGLITMSPQLYEIVNIKFLDKLDVIGCNIYPSICYREDYNKVLYSNFFDNFSLGANLRYLEGLTKRYNKPLFILECGCQPYKDRLANPGESALKSTLDNDAQTVYYKIALPTLELVDFINGYFIWEGNGTGSYDPFYKGREKTKKFIEEFMERIENEQYN